MDHFQNETIRFAKTRHYLQLVVCVWGTFTIFRKLKSFRCFYSLSKIYNFRNIVHFLKRILQVVDNAVFWQNVVIVVFRKRSIQSEFLDVFYCGHVTYQIWAWFETFEGSVNRPNTVDFDAHWTSGTSQKGGFEIPLATDITRIVVRFLPP